MVIKISIDNRDNRCKPGQLTTNLAQLLGNGLTSVQLYEDQVDVPSRCLKMGSCMVGESKAETGSMLWLLHGRSRINLAVICARTPIQIPVMSRSMSSCLLNDCIVHKLALHVYGRVDLIMGVSTPSDPEWSVVRIGRSATS